MDQTLYEFETRSEEVSQILEKERRRLSDFAGHVKRFSTQDNLPLLEDKVGTEISGYVSSENLVNS